MKHIEALESNSSPKIAKAAQAIAKNKLEGYCPYLIDALTREIEKTRAWKTQCQLIEAIGLTECQEGLPLLRALLSNDYEHTVLYQSLGFSIFMLENSSAINLGFLFESIESGNDLQISGACSAILYKRLIPIDKDIKRIVDGISIYTKDEGKILTPRCYIAAVAHLWPKETTTDFLNECKKSQWAGLVNIAELALQGKKSQTRLI